MTEAKFNNLPILNTDRLLLRTLRWGDAADIYEYASDPAVPKYNTWSVHESIEDTKRFLKAVMDCYKNHQLASWGILHKADNKIIGTCGLANWIPDQARAEIGYALSRKYWGQGYMPEAVCPVITFGFRMMKLNRIEGRCIIPNTASARVMEKVGMKFEGVLRQHLFVKGSFHDVKMYSILKEEWTASAPFEKLCSQGQTSNQQKNSRPT